MSEQRIESLFAGDIRRRIEEVIKVDQTDEDVIAEEISEYVVTGAIRKHYASILERYHETPNKPHEGIAVWVSGFFGSGKSSFAKLLGLALEDREVRGTGAAARFAERAGDPHIEVLLRNIAERIPTDAVIFDVSTDRGIRSGNQTLTEITYRLFLQSLGYAKDLDLAELEITLEAEGRLDEFEETYRRLFDRDWDQEKGKVALALNQASRVMNALDPETCPEVDSWVQAAKSRADISPGGLAQRCLELMGRRRPDRNLVFVIDEVGQFVARDVQKMLDLQGIVQSLGRVGRGRLWIVVTSQEKLDALVGGLEGSRVELARLMDRFPLQVHLEPSDISEVTSRRVLTKNAEAQKRLRALFEEHRGRLTGNTRLTAEIRLPELTAESFVDLYPLLPYQVDLIIQVVSGLRTQGGASKHVGGANRTIIKLAQQLLINPAVNLAEQPVGKLARIDQIYDLVEGNIDSEIRGKISAIAEKVDHPLAQPVAKAICLLQFVQSIHRTPENIAAALHPAIDADSRLSAVREALQALVAARQVRRGDDGYRIPSPVEDDWETQRSKLPMPKPVDIHRIHTEAVQQLWTPQPSHVLQAVRTFKAGLHLNGAVLSDGDLVVKLQLAQPGKDLEERLEEARTRSQTERTQVFWVAELDDAIDAEAVEIYRSKEMLARKERGAQTRDESNLVTEEKRRLKGHQDELRRLLKTSLLSGSVYFRGNDRSPAERASDVGKAAAQILGQVLPEVFDRFSEAAARMQAKDRDALTNSENLHGLTPVFAELHLVRDERGKPAFVTDSGPLAEVLAMIENRYRYGQTASGRYLADELQKDPYGWDFEAVKLFVLALLRAGKIDVTSKGQTFESAQSLDAKSTFSNNNLFRQASFRPKKGLDYAELVQASEAFEAAFGKVLPELEQGAAASVLRNELSRHEGAIREVYDDLLTHRLPGAEVLASALGQIGAIRLGNDPTAIVAFNGSHAELKEAIDRARELSQKLTEPALGDLARARTVMEREWPFLDGEPETSAELRKVAADLSDTLRRETFFRELPAIDQCARAIRSAYEEAHRQARTARAAAYERALDQLRATPGWADLDDDQQELVSAPLASRATEDGASLLPIPQLRAELEACPARLNQCIEEALRLLDGARLVRVSAASYFAGGVETEEQLDQALEGLREECASHIGSGKKVLVQ